MMPPMDNNQSADFLTTHRSDSSKPSLGSKLKNRKKQSPKTKKGASLLGILDSALQFTVYKFTQGKTNAQIHWAADLTPLHWQNIPQQIRWAASSRHLLVHHQNGSLTAVEFVNLGTNEREPTYKAIEREPLVSGVSAFWSEGGSQLSQYCPLPCGKNWGKSDEYRQDVACDLLDGRNNYLARGNNLDHLRGGDINPPASSSNINPNINGSQYETGSSPLKEAIISLKNEGENSPQKNSPPKISRKKKDRLTISTTTNNTPIFSNRIDRRYLPQGLPQLVTYTGDSQNAERTEQLISKYIHRGGQPQRHRKQKHSETSIPQKYPTSGVENCEVAVEARERVVDLLRAQWGGECESGGAVLPSENGMYVWCETDEGLVLLTVSVPERGEKGEVNSLEENGAKSPTSVLAPAVLSSGFWSSLFKSKSPSPSASDSSIVPQTTQRLMYVYRKTPIFFFDQTRPFRILSVLAKTGVVVGCSQLNLYEGRGLPTTQLKLHCQSCVHLLLKMWISSEKCCGEAICEFDGRKDGLSGSEICLDVPVWNCSHPSPYFTAVTLSRQFEPSPCFEHILELVFHDIIEDAIFVYKSVSRQVCQPPTDTSSTTPTMASSKTTTVLAEGQEAQLKKEPKAETESEPKSEYENQLSLGEHTAKNDTANIFNELHGISNRSENIGESCLDCFVKISDTCSDSQTKMQLVLTTCANSGEFRALYLWLKLIKCFKDVLPNVVIALVRKSEPVVTPSLVFSLGDFDARKMFENCINTGSLRAASLYLIVLQNSLGPLKVRTDCVLLLIQQALKQNALSLCQDLVTFFLALYVRENASFFIHTTAGCAKYSRSVENLGGEASSRRRAHMIKNHCTYLGKRDDVRRLWRPCCIFRGGAANAPPIISKGSDGIDSESAALAYMHLEVIVSDCLMECIVKLQWARLFYIVTELNLDLIFWLHPYRHHLQVLKFQNEDLQGLSHQARNQLTPTLAQGASGSQQEEKVTRGTTNNFKIQNFYASLECQFQSGTKDHNALQSWSPNTSTISSLQCVRWLNSLDELGTNCLPPSYAKRANWFQKTHNGAQVPDAKPDRAPTVQRSRTLPPSSNYYARTFREPSDEGYMYEGTSIHEGLLFGETSSSQHPFECLRVTNSSRKTKQAATEVYVLVFYSKVFLSLGVMGPSLCFALAASAHAIVHEILLRDPVSRKQLKHALETGKDSRLQRKIMHTIQVLSNLS